MAMSLHSFSQSRFSKRRYTKGMFVEKTHSLGFKTEKTKETGEMIPEKENYIGLSAMPLYADAMESLVTQEEPAMPVITVLSSSVAKNGTGHEWVRRGVGSQRHKQSGTQVCIKIPSLLQKTACSALATVKENHQPKHASDFCLNEDQKKIQGFFWKEFFDRENLQHLRFKDCSLQGIGLGLIEYYQSYISPKKGFGCSYRLFAHGDSCSEYGKKAIQDQGIFIGSVNTFIRLGACDKISRKMNHRGLCMSDEECGSLMFIGWGH